MMSEPVWIEGNSDMKGRDRKNFALTAVLSYNFIFKSRYRVSNEANTQRCSNEGI